MKKEMQKLCNNRVEEFIERMNRCSFTYTKSERLRSCNATVMEYVDNLTGEVIYILMSYRTLVAGVSGNVCYDFLRKVYGYTATSAQHINKFFRDYSTSPYAYSTIYTWRDA